MNDSISLDELAAAMSRRGAPMSAQTALVIALGAVEAMGGERLVLAESSIEIDGDGVVHLREGCERTEDARAVQIGLMNLIEGLRLEPDPALDGFLKRLRSATTFSPAGLAAELTAAIEPLDVPSARAALGGVVCEHYRPARERVAARRRAAEEAAIEAPTPTPDAVVRSLVEELRADSSVDDEAARRAVQQLIVQAKPEAPAPAPPPRRGVNKALVFGLAAAVVLALLALALRR